MTHHHHLHVYIGRHLFADEFITSISLTNSLYNRQSVLTDNSIFNEKNGNIVLKSNFYSASILEI